MDEIPNNHISSQPIPPPNPFQPDNTTPPSQKQDEPRHKKQKLIKTISIACLILGLVILRTVIYPLFITNIFDNQNKAAEERLRSEPFAYSSDTGIGLKAPSGSCQWQRPNSYAPENIGISILCGINDFYQEHGTLPTNDDIDILKALIKNENIQNGRYTLTIGEQNIPNETDFSIHYDIACSPYYDMPRHLTVLTPLYNNEYSGDLERRCVHTNDLAVNN